MDTAFRYLQQEQSRLQAENTTQQQQIETLRQYVEVIAKLYYAVQKPAAHTLDRLDQFLHEVIRVMGATDGSLSRLEPDTEELVFTIVHGAVRDQLTGYRMKSDVGIAGWVVAEQEPVIVNNTRQDWRFYQKIDSEFMFHSRSILCVPVMKGAHLAGVIQIINKQKGEFSETDQTLAMTLADFAAAVLETV